MKPLKLILSFSILIIFTLSGYSQQTLKVAIGQIFCLDGDREGNFVRIEHAIREAKENGADLITFPETSILGWVNPTAHERAYPIPGVDSDRISELARKYDLWITIGLAEKEGDKLFDSAILVDNLGVIKSKHRKINTLDELMDRPYTKGNEVAAVQTKWGKIGIIICADSWGEGIIDRMEKQNPDLMLIPYGWAAAEEQWPEHGKQLESWVTHIARTLECPVVGTDLVGEISHGPWTGLVYGGQSLAADKNGEVIVRCVDRDKEVKIVELEIGNWEYNDE